MPIILAFISYIFKRGYPIDDESRMVEIQMSIKLQKDFHEAHYNQQEKYYDFYLINDPIYNTRHIHLLYLLFKII
jgi:hypothetical protein